MHLTVSVLPYLCAWNPLQLLEIKCYYTLDLAMVVCKFLRQGNQGAYCQGEILRLLDCIDATGRTKHDLAVI